MENQAGGRTQINLLAGCSAQANSTLFAIKHGSLHNQTWHTRAAYNFPATLARKATTKQEQHTSKPSLIYTSMTMENLGQTGQRSEDKLQPRYRDLTNAITGLVGQKARAKSIGHTFALL